MRRRRPSETTTTPAPPPRAQLGDVIAGPTELLARVAAKTLDVSIGIIVVDDGDPRIEASHGLEEGVSLLESEIVQEALRAGPLFVLNDASRSVRFRDDPLVASAPYARFCAARRLQVPRGMLLLLDSRPRPFDEADRAALDDLARLVEGHLERARHGLSPEELAAAFPFGFVLDRSLRIVHGGRALAKVCDAAVFGSAFDETFLVRRPNVALKFESLAASRGALFVLESIRSGALLRGSISRIGRGDTLVFLGSPWLTTAGDMERLGLGIQDFALHDPAMDMLQLLETRSVSILELRQLNVALTQAKAKAEQATRATGSFLAHMSHELRTPMNAVLGMATLVLDTQLRAEQRDYIETIRSSGENLLSVVNDVLDYSKIESGMMTVEPLPFSLPRLIDDSLDLVALQTARKGLELAGLSHPGVPEWLLGDAGRIRQILLNLLSNAAKFTSQGHVAVITSYDDATSMLEISVEDTGIGISPEAFKDIFLPFAQGESSTTRRFGGTGLGLTISRRLASIMRGDVEVESEVGKGSRFILRLPAPRAEPRATSASPRALGRRVVLCEPVSLQERALHQRLELLGAVVFRAGSLEMALQRCSLDAADVLVVGARGIEEASAIVATVRAATSIPLVVCAPAGVRVEGRDVRVVQRPAELRRLARAVAESFDVSEPSERDAPPKSVLALRILLVEDDLVNQRVATLLLARHGLQCDVVANGYQAIERVSLRTYDVVLMDVQMPELDGIEATRRIRALPVAQPFIVALTASTLAGERDACFAAGVSSFLPKPIDPEELYATLAGVARPPE